MKVFLKYGFLFDPAELWSHRHEFESTLAGMFKSIGIQAEQIRSINEEDNSEIMLFLTRDEMVEPEQKERTPKQKLSLMRTKKGHDGKFKKGDGSDG